MSWIATDKPRDARRKPKKVGKPKDEGGHTRLNISISKSIREYLKKTENMSEYIESLIFFDQFVSGRAPGHIMFFGDGSACAGLPWKNIKYRKVPRWQIVGFLVVSSEMTNKSTSQN